MIGAETYSILIECLNSNKTLDFKYISDLLELKKSNYSLRSAKGINLQEQQSKLKYYGDRAFSVCAPQLWNMLPNSVKTSPNMDILKKNLKTYFFKIAFS